MPPAAMPFERRRPGARCDVPELDGLVGRCRCKAHESCEKATGVIQLLFASSVAVQVPVAMSYSSTGLSHNVDARTLESCKTANNLAQPLCPLSVRPHAVARALAESGD